MGCRYCGRSRGVPLRVEGTAAGPWTCRRALHFLTEAMGRIELKPLDIGGVSIWPPVVLAPMAGETGSVLRILCRRLGAGLVCTELTSSHGLFYGNQRSLDFLRWTVEERPISAQIFG